MEVIPNKKFKDKRINLYELVTELRERGVRLPLLLRFPGIIQTRIELINQCFRNSIKEYKYKAQYLGAYPLKVNQQRHIVEEIIQFGKPYNLGLECGSKPELLISLAVMSTKDALIICNGFKDSSYVEMALLSRKLGKNTIIVVDRAEEINIILKASKKLNIKPRIGFRCKLESQSSGRWESSSGSKSKFGLTPSEIVSGVSTLKECGLLDCLELLHFHIGSQIPSIQNIKTSVKEGARFYTELHNMGAKIKFIDVGGGLGIDYDGSGNTESSINYSEQEYTNDVVSIIQSVCEESSVPQPHIVSESGRALVAHSALLVFEVLGSSRSPKEEINFNITKKDSSLINELIEIYQGVNSSNVNEYYNDLIDKKSDILQLFSYGSLSLEQRAKAEDIYLAISKKILRITKTLEGTDQIHQELEKNLSNTYFCNFSIFQSLPDSWALEQHFPFAPLQMLDKEPSNKAILADLTCDSDGKVDNFIDSHSGKSKEYIKIHNLQKDKEYYMAAFLTGAYQEILGDLHNLFGDTDAVHISVHKDGNYSVDHVIEGDSITKVLNYVQYSKSYLIEKIRKKGESSILQGEISRNEARLLMKYYEEGLSDYTYLK